MRRCPSCTKDSPDGSRFCPFCGTKLPDEPKKPTDPLIGRVIDGKYAVQERIGSGAMGNIYKAEHKALSKVVALKVLHKHLVREESHVKRFHREAKAASKLNHPNCITVLDFGQTDDGWSYIAMEYLPGRDLCRILFEEGPLSPARASHVMTQVLDALDEAHAAGVIHRDLKPENVMIEKLRSDPDFVKVLDFGIAKIRDFNGTEQSSFKTATGMVFGTPEYMSPEQIRGEELDGRSDLYSLGVVLYQALCGELPFQGESVLEVATAHLTQAPPPLRGRKPGLPDAICKVVERLMAKKRDDRFPTAAEARDALMASVRSETPREPVQEVAPPIDVFARTTSKVARPEPSADDVREPATVLQEPPPFPVAVTRKGWTSFRFLLLAVVGLVAVSALVFLYYVAFRQG
jgi:serine/threonine-protein kinase